MEDKQFKVQGFSITDRELKIIEEVSNKRRLFNYSLALRTIINEWHEMTHRLDYTGIEGEIYNDN